MSKRARAPRRAAAPPPAPAPPAAPASDEPPAAPAGAPLSAGKRRAFTVLALLLPFLLLAGAEGVLRLVGYGKDYPLFVDGPAGYWMENREVAGRYFYHNENLPNPLFDFMEREKRPETFRIVVLGESSAAGFPFYYGAAFSRQLQDRLQQTFPDRKIEVFNTAMAAISSYALRDFLPEILEKQPDAVVIYAGHNEYYGALGVGSTESIGRSPAVVNLYLKLQRFRLVQALRGGLVRLAGAGRTPQDGTLMERMVGQQRIPLGSDLFAAGQQQFEANLDAILARLKAAGVPTFVGTLASNERGMPPFLSAGSAAFAAKVQAAEAQIAQNPSAAKAALAALVAEDSTSATARFALGTALLALGDTAQARQAFVQAKDRDELRFRAPEAFNASIRRLAAQHGAAVAETQAALASASPAGIIGPEMMTEHLHPTPRGYFLIADAFYRAMQAQRLVGAWTRAVPPDSAYRRMALTRVDSLVGAYRLLQLQSGWPFQPLGQPKDLIDTVQARTFDAQTALRLYKGEIDWQTANAQARAQYEREGRFGDALTAARAALAEMPYSPAPYLDAANTLMLARRYGEAIPYLQQSIQRGPTTQAEGLLGTLYLQRGDRAQAIVHLQRAIALDGRNAQALYNLAGAYALEKRFAEAMPLLDRVLQVDPGRADARSLKAQIEPILRGR